MIFKHNMLFLKINVVVWMGYGIFLFALHDRVISMYKILIRMELETEIPMLHRFTYSDIMLLLSAKQTIMYIMVEVKE